MDRLRLLSQVVGWLLLAACGLAWLHGPLGVSPFWPPTLLANLLHELCWAALLCGLVALLGARRFTLGVLLVTQPLALLLWTGSFERPLRAEAYRPLKIATMNVGHLQRGPGPIVEHLLAERFDLVALQEIDPELERRIELDLAAAYPHQWIERRGSIAVGVLSAHPFQQLERPPFEAPDWWFEPQLLALDVGGEEVQVLAHHAWVWAAGLGSADASLADLLTGALALRPAPRVLLLGDWNSAPTSALAARLRRFGFTDAYQAAAGDLAGTFALRDPLGVSRPPWVRLDHAWWRGDLAPIRARIGPSLGADHLGVELLLDLGPAARQL